MFAAFLNRQPDSCDYDEVHPHGFAWHRKSERRRRHYSKHRGRRMTDTKSLHHLVTSATAGGGDQYFLTPPPLKRRRGGNNKYKSTPNISIDMAPVLEVPQVAVNYDYSCPTRIVAHHHRGQSVNTTGSSNTSTSNIMLKLPNENPPQTSASAASRKDLVSSDDPMTTASYATAMTSIFPAGISFQKTSKSKQTMSLSNYLSFGGGGGVGGGHGSRDLSTAGLEGDEDVRRLIEDSEAGAQNRRRKFTSKGWGRSASTTHPREHQSHHAKRRLIHQTSLAGGGGGGHGYAFYGGYGTGNCSSRTSSTKERTNDSKDTAGDMSLIWGNSSQGR